MSTTVENEPDINDAFDSIALSENNLQQEGYDEGFIKGEQDGVIDGFHVGFHKGVDIGTEIGYYSGIVETYLALYIEYGLNEKTKQVLLKLRELISQLPTSNDPNIDIISLLENIRAKYKMVCSLLKINPFNPSAGEFSF